MTLQWTLVAVILYLEIALVMILMIPWIRPPTWQKIFRSRLIRSFDNYSTVASYVAGGILTLLFVDAIREVRKYSSAGDEMESVFHTANSDAVIHMKLFRAQRNLYISGFALFLSMVLKRMVSLISREAQLMASAEAAMKQAQGASAAAQAMIAKDKKGGSESESPEVTALRETLDKLTGELEKTKKDRDAMKEQAEGVKREYDRLMKEYDALSAQDHDGKDD